MKRIAVGLVWTFLLMWAGNYLSLYADLPPVLTSVSAVAIGTLIAIAPIQLVQSRVLSRPIDAAATSSVATDPLARILG